jgi:hypothetical protein
MLMINFILTAAMHDCEKLNENVISNLNFLFVSFAVVLCLRSPGLCTRTVISVVFVVQGLLL